MVLIYITLDEDKDGITRHNQIQPIFRNVLETLNSMEPIVRYKKSLLGTK